MEDFGDKGGIANGGSQTKARGYVNFELKL